jgi:hypothetical protein
MKESQREQHQSEHNIHVAQRAKQPIGESGEYARRRQRRRKGVEVISLLLLRDGEVKNGVNVDT